MILTNDIAKNLITDPALSTKEYTTITPDAARILAHGYRHRTSPLVGVAGRFVTESQLDLSGLTVLDAESATALADWGCEDGAFIMTLDLSGLTKLTPDLATALAAWSPALECADGGCGLWLDGVVNASAETLAVLAGWKPSCISATLSLNGLKNVDVAQAKAICGWQGADAFSQLLLCGVTEIGQAAAAELSQWTGEQLALGLRSLTPKVAGALASFNGNTLELKWLTEIDIVTARQLFNPEVECSSASAATGWEMLDLGSESEILKGITPAVADWITELRIGNVDVKLSKLTELAVYANSTFRPKLDAPKKQELSIGGSGGINAFGGTVCCPFCGQQVGIFTKTQNLNDAEPFEAAEGADIIVHDRVNPETWDEQWNHAPCPHVIAVTCGSRPVVKIAGVTPERTNTTGRIQIKAIEYGHVLSMNMTFEFAPIIL